MKTRLTRRQALQFMVWGGLGGLTTACASRSPATSPAPTRIPAMPLASTPRGGNVSTPTPPPDTQPEPFPQTNAQTLVADLTRTAQAFLAALDDSQRTQATYAFADAERVRWHWTTPRNFPRHGLPLKEMTQAQRDRALALLQVSVSEGGYQKALDIISLQNDLGNDPALYYVSVFGAPGAAAPWGWRFEGHHLSRHVTVAGDQLAMTPFFLGAWPTVSSSGLKAMEREEWAARELINSLEGRQRQAALFQERPLSRHVTQNEPYVTPLDPAGLPAAEFNADQQTLMLEIIQTYLGTLPADLAATHVARLRDTGLENIRFGWAGSLEPRRPHYYRLQGPTFLLEFDNSRNGGTHIHSVWRDFAEDFGQHLA